MPADRRVFRTESETTEEKASEKSGKTTDEKNDDRADQSDTASESDDDRVQRLVDQALAKERARHDRETEQLRGQLPQGTVPLFAGGVEPGENAETWSQFDQDLAQRGEHPWQNDESADHLVREDDREVKGGITVRKDR